jgi:hypothetical protein
MRQSNQRNTCRAFQAGFSGRPWGWKQRYIPRERADSSSRPSARRQRRKLAQSGPALRTQQAHGSRHALADMEGQALGSSALKPIESVFRDFFAQNASSMSKAVQVPRGNKDAAGAFLGEFPGTGYGTYTALPVCSHLHGGGKWPRIRHLSFYKQ